jgi:PAS domain S-box-containing protein
LKASFNDDSRYRLLVNSVTDYAIYMLDADGIVASWNPGAQRFKGYESAEILGQHFSRFYTEEDRATGLPERALKTAATEGRFEHEGWRVRKDGTRFWAHVIIDPIRDPSGELLGYAKVTRDLSDRKIAEEALRRSEERFKLLVQGVTDYAIYMLDPDGRVTNWNVGAERIKGYLADEIVGEHFSRFYTEEDRAAGMPKKVLETAAREGRFEKEGWRVRKDGSHFWANRHRRHPGRAGQLDRLRQSNPRHVAKERSGARTRAGAGVLLAVAENGGGWSPDRRHRA